MQKEKHTPFTTKEVVTLVVITCLVSFFMGSILFLNDKDDSKFKDSNLDYFIEQYNYIVDNYYEDINKKEIIDGAVKGMVEALGDDYSAYLEKDTSENFNITLNGSYEGIGVSVAETIKNEIMVIGIFKNSPADKAGLKPMDVIKKVDNQDTSGKSATDLTKMIKNSKKDSIKITVKRENEEKEIIVKKDIVTIESVTSKVINENNKKIGYVQVGIFADNTFKQFKHQLEELEQQKIDDLIIDLRGNSGGHLDVVVNMTSLFLNSDKVIFQIQTKDDIEKIFSNGKKDKSYPIYILIDNDTASASEVMASALNEQLNATLIGQTSYGKGTIQEVKNTASGDQYKFTTKKWLTSKGVWLKNNGLKPNVIIELDDKYFDDPKEENDNQLKEAIKIISEKQK